MACPGPFPTKQIEPDLLADVGGEANVRPKEGDTTTTKDGARLTWTRFRSKEDLVNLEQLFGIQQWSVVYLYCELNSDQAFDTGVRGECGRWSSLWINGRKAGQVPASGWRGPVMELRHLLPIRLNAGRNSCLLKIRREREEWSLSFQPLPAEQAKAEVHVADPGGTGVANALVEFYAQRESVGRVTTDETGKAEACLFPLARAYDVRVLSGDAEAWLFGVAVQLGQRKRFEVEVHNEVSISGRVLAMDASPQDAIVVQAIRVPDPSNAGRADLPGRPEVGAERQFSYPNEDYRIQSLLPMPFSPGRSTRIRTGAIVS